MEGTANGAASPVIDAYEFWEETCKTHHAGTFPNDMLRVIEGHLPKAARFSAETGCGKSTVLLSNIAKDHTVFCLDDRSMGDGSSVRFYEQCPITRMERIHAVFGPTQLTLPTFRQKHKYDVVLLDGPHGWPFPELEYYFFYPHIVAGGLLIVDDCNIPTVGRMADIIAEDDMWDQVAMVGTTGIFRRTDATTFDPTGDGWWEQRYSRRRVSVRRNIHLADVTPVDQISGLKLDALLHGDR